MNFDNLDEQTARKAILNEVRLYAEKFHRVPEYHTGDKISYAKRVYDENEIVALVDSALEFWLTSGRYTELFETELAKFLNLEHALFVNSGSSANLLAFMALTSPLLGNRAIQHGDEVITSATCFPTTVTPIVQYGAIPVFVDSEIPGYNIKLDELGKALSPKTKAVILAHTLGNPFNIERVLGFCREHNLWLIEDNCDALGSKYTLNGKAQYTGSFGDIGTSSFYPPHHMTTGEGGAVYTSDPLLHKIMLSLRDWGRDCRCPSGRDNMCGNRFSGQHGELPFGYDHKYVYSHFGYNLKATDMQAAIGTEQLKKLPSFIERRRANFDFLKKELCNLESELILPEPEPNSEPSWFGFPITLRDLKEKLPLVQHIETKGIQTRSLFSGNILRHPCSVELLKKWGHYRVVSDLKNSDLIMNGTFWLGVYPGMTNEMLQYISNTIKEYFIR